MLSTPFESRNTWRKLANDERDEMMSKMDDMLTDNDSVLMRESSCSRGRVLLSILRGIPSDDPEFWRLFNEWFSACDNTHLIQGEFKEALRQHGRGIEWLSPDGMAFFDSIPDQVTLYRGCSRSRIHALSWTTDSNVAAGFATGHRSIRVPDPVLASATIRKAEILTVVVTREESEVIWIPTEDHKINVMDCKQSHGQTVR